MVATPIASTVTADDRPNVIVIMVDDLGFSDIGCYGSEIETPHLDALAAGGLRFSQFYNTAKCHSSRVSLLTGQYCIAAGDTSLSHGVTSAEVLGGNGYDTSMVGKWHLKQEPTDFGFDRYWGHLSGACNYFKGDNTFRLGRQPWKVPAENFYTTVANVDYGLKFLADAEKNDKPWYLYVAFNAPHAPLQALPEDYAKYEGRYDAGWDTVREKRLAKQGELGLLPEGVTPSDRPAHIPAWDSLSDARKRFENKRMTTLAAMIDRVDQEIGRLVDHLQHTDQLDNTLIWFVSDNGACPYDRTSNQIEAKPTDGSVMWSDSTGWAWARNSPFRYYKQNQFEGGIASPAIVHWPAGLKTPAGSIDRQPAHLIDIMPTLADLTQSNVPTAMNDRELRPVSGQSLRPLLEGGVVGRKQPLHFLFAADRGLRDGDWKIVSFRSGPWEIYNVRNDRTEQNNLADREPERLKSMVTTWQTMARDVLHANGRNTAAVSQKSTEHTHPEWTNFASDPTAGVRGNVDRNAASPKKRRKAKQKIRARKNTTMEVKADTIHLTFSGDDPGLAFESLPSDLPVGPYALAFELKSDATGNGEAYYTTDDKTSLPNGQHLTFNVVTDGNWHSHKLNITTSKQICKLRLDVSDNAGTAQLRGLRLIDASGNVLIKWPRK
ncbi:arylsulfatase [Planctomycetes bacterium K23_9]|uniref:Arylsulfatase n=1 Tax=Stieleria marina TaxID=1930275 RepID=A0A517NNC2_9BACT|nr:Arylsulfatase [Planctomycetes bacterium K23_9]